MNYDADFRAEVWVYATRLTFIQFGIIVYLCYVGLIVCFFRKKETAYGVICAICAIVCFAQPFGILLSLLFGWLNAKRWQIRAFMTVYTLLFIITSLNFAAFFALRQLDYQQRIRLFGAP
jgi:hypothetical protein